MQNLFSRKGQEVLKKAADLSVSYLWFRRLQREFLSKQLATFFDNVLSKYQCGFRKGHGTHNIVYCLCWKNERRLQIIKQHFEALLTDLSKAFACLNHELLLPKLHASGLSLSSLELVHDYLLNRKQRTKVNSKYSSLADILEGVPQGPILGPLLFNIFLCDLFIVYDTTYFASYAVDNANYIIKNTVTEVFLHEIETVQKNFFMWFTKNQMMTNVGKCHLILNPVKHQTIEINGFPIKNSHCEKLLGVHLDDQLIFH